MTYPKNWEKTKMGDIGKYLNGKAFKSGEWKSSGRPIIRIQNLTGSGSEYNYFQGVVEDRYVVMPGDLLFSWSATLGTYIWQGPEAVLNQHIFKVESRIDKKFHRYLLDFKIQEMQSQTHGSGMVHITKKSFDAIEVHIPPIDEQHKIVELLEDHLSRLDAAVADVKQAKIKAAQFRRSLLHSIFDGQVEEFGNKNQWNDYILSDVTQNLDNKRIPVNSKERSKRLGSVPYYGATGQVGTIDIPMFNEDLLLLGEDGVQFFDPSKSKAYLISGPAWVNNHVHVLKAIDSKANQKLLMHYLNQFNYVGYANGTTRLKLTQGAMNKIPISLPNRKIQEKMLEYIELQLSIVEASVVSAYYVAVQSLSLRRALLQSAFTGQLTKEVAVV